MGWNNKPLKDLESTILNETNLPKYLWTDAVSITWYMMNRVLIRPILQLTHYELNKVRKPIIYHLYDFRCKYFVLNNRKDNLGKFDSKVDEGLF